MSISSPQNDPVPARARSASGPGWILVAGLALAALGLVTESQVQDDGGDFSSAPFTNAFATADSNGSMIAVTGMDVTGGALLYLVDTETRHLAIYQAQGGAKSTQSLKFIGGRNIELDLQVDGYNDKSEHTYKDLREEFEKNGLLGTVKK